MKVFKRSMALLLCLAMTLGLFAGLTLTANAADVTIASWGAVSMAANTAVNASSYQGSTAPKMTSNKAITSSATYAYYGGSAGGATITISSLPSGYKTKSVSFYSRASKGGNFAVSYSTDGGSTYTSAGTSSTLGTSGTAKQYTVTFGTAVENVTNIKFAHSATTGSLYFGTVTVTGEAAATKTLSSIAVSSNHRSFTVGDTFVKETVTATYSDSSTADVTNSATFSGYNMSSAGTQTVTASYTEGGVTKTATYQITVAAPVQYALTYSVNGDTSVISSGNYTSGTSVTLPTASDIAGYIFAGWVASAISTETTTAPTVLTGSYPMPAANTTLYAVYTRTEGGSGGSSSTYQLVTSASDLVVGSSIVIAAKDYNYAISTTQNSNNRGQAAITKSSNTIALGSGVAEFTLEEGTTTGTYSFKDSNGYLYAASSTANNMKSETNKSGNSSWTVSVSNGTASLVANGSNSRKTMQYNQSSSIFSCYSSASQKALALYQKSGSSSTTYYTTSPVVAAKYDIIVDDDIDNGIIYFGDLEESGSVEAGTTLTLGYEAETGYQFDGYVLTNADTDADVTATYISGNTLTMPAFDVILSGSFSVIPASVHTVTTSSNAGGSISSNKNSAEEGDSVTISITPAEHYHLTSLTVDGSAAAVFGNSYTFNMPGHDVAVAATFAEDAKYTVTFYDKDGNVKSTEQVYGGAKPTSVPAVNDTDGFTFLGWVANTYDSTIAPTLIDPANTTINLATEFHAVYGEGSGGSSNTFVLTNTITAGKDYIFVSTNTTGSAYALDSTDLLDISPSGTGKTANALAVTVTSDNKVDIGSNSSLVFHANETDPLDMVTTVGDVHHLTINGNGIGYNDVSSKLFYSSYLYGTNGKGDKTYCANYSLMSGENKIQATSGATGRMYAYERSSASYTKYTTNPVATSINVTWMNGSETFASGKVAFGDPITAPTTDPEKTEAEMEYYTFAGWAEEEGGAIISDFPPASADLGDKTYYAVYTTNAKLTVTWNNYNNSTLATEYYKNGETPSYKGEEPTKPADSSFYYTFSGWTPTVSPVTAAITYTAAFEQHDRFELTASLAKDTVKADRYTQVNYTLTDAGEATTAFTPTYTVGDSSIATVDANGRISALAVGSTTVTITFPDCFDAQGNPLTKTMNLTVVENVSNGGYTLITQDNVPEDWTGDYIIMGKPGGDTAYMNTWMILTPNYDGGSVKIATNNEDAATITITDDGTGIGIGTINDEGNATSGVEKAIIMEDTGLVTTTGGDDSVLVYDTITEIDDAYAFTVECIDDVNQIYTIRVKDTDLYLACAKTGVTNNSLNFDSNATEYAQWQFSVQRVTKGGYNNDIIVAQNIGNDERCLYFNSNSYGATNGQFRDYRNGSTDSHIGGDASGKGLAYDLYLFGNPNPFKAQIYYHGEQITLVETGKVNANAQTAQLTGALTPDIDNYPNWTQVGDPVWEIVENSTGNHMTIDSATGLITTNSSTVGSYALVKITYTVHDEVNNVDKLVSTTSKVEVIDADTTYSTVIYELYSGEDTEVQYTVPNSMTELPLAAYVVNDTTDDNSKTGSTVMGGTLNWTITSTSTSMFGTFSIDANGVLHMSNVTKDSIVTVKVTGATGDNMAATAATYKIYVKTADYTLTVVPTPDSQGTYDADSDVLTVAGSETSAHLTYNVVDDNGNGPSDTTFRLAGGAWTISGESYGALINSNGLLDFSKMDRSEDHTITAVASRVAATDATTGTIKSGLTDTITIVVKAKVNEDVMEAVDDLVIVDYALPVTFNVLTNDNINVAVEVTADTLPSGVVNNGAGSFTFTPNGWLTTDQTYDYTVAGKVNGTDETDTATVTLKTADAVYYEDTYSGIFTFTGDWTDLIDGSAIAQQTSSLDTADIFEYDANYENYAMYSGGTAKTTTVTKGVKPTVSFTFAGTGFDVISATTNNGGAVLMTIKDAGGNMVKDPVTGRNLNAIYDNFRGYVYCEEEYHRYTLDQVKRGDWDGTKFTPNPLGDWYWDHDNNEYKQPVNGNWYDLPYSDKAGNGASGATGVDGINLYDSYDNGKDFDETYADVEAFFAEYLDPAGTFIIKQHQSHWKPYEKNQSEADNFNTNFYQIPIMKITGLPYGTYTVTLQPTYSSAYDRQGDESYDFIFDGVRIHNPVADRAAEYKYINFSDIVDADGFGSGEIIPCDHEGTGRTDWTFYSKATNTTSPTTCNRGSFVRYCTYCGAVTDTAYFHVSISAYNDVYTIGVDGYNDLPDTTVLRYTLTADAGDNQAAIQAKLDAWQGTLTEYWSSHVGGIMTCMNNSSVAIASSAGTTYATLQLKDPATQTIYASAIHSPMITVEQDTSHNHVWSTWTHNDGSDPSTHSATCSAAGCEVGTKTENCVFTDKVTTAPTYEAAGVRTYICSDCGYQYTETIPALTGFTATFHVPEGAKAPAAQVGESATMPAAVAAPATWNAQTYKFVGWVAATADNVTDAPTFYSANETVPMSSNMDFYALYSYSAAGAGGDSDEFTLVTDASTLAANDRLLLVGIESGSYYAAKAFNDGDSNLKRASVSNPVSNKITLTADYDGAILTLGGAAGNWTLFDGANYLYAAGGTGSNNWLKGTSSADNLNAQWTISIGSGNKAIIKTVDNNVDRHTIRHNTGSSLFSCYASGQDDVYLYRSTVTSVTKYTTELAKACTHENTTTITTAATCTVAGSTVVTCDDCHKTISTTPIPALGHYLDAGTVTTPATCTAEGVLTKSCTREGCTYTETEAITALGHTYTYTDNGDDATHSISCSVCHFNGGNENHTWSGDECSKCHADKPAVSDPVWRLLTNASELKSGMQIVIASNTQSFTAGDISSSVMAKVASTFSSDKSTITSLGNDTVILTVGGSTGSWTFSNANGNKLGATAAKKVAWDGGTTTWSVTISGGDATIQNSNSSYGRFLYNVTSPRFTTYATSTKPSASMVMPQIYYLDTGTKSATRSATRSIAVTREYNGVAIIDGMGTTNSADDHAAYGPEHGVYLAPGQGIVFYLTSDVTDISYQDLQIGAKAVNGTATAIDVASISNGNEYSSTKYLLESKAIASATEMYYDLDASQVSWNNGTSSILVVYNSGKGVLDVTNLRYSTANGNTLRMHINEAATKKAAKMIQIVYGEPITDPDPIEPFDLDLNFKSAELVLNSDIAINFNVDEAVIDSADGIYAVFTKALYNEAGEITGYYDETVSDAIYNEETGLYSFRFTGINPAEMGSAVTAQLFGYRDGELVSGSIVNYSVLSYINRMYAKNDDAAFHAMLADLAAYGAAAQNYVDYNTANLVTAKVTDGLMDYATKEAPELNNATTISGDGIVKFTAAYLSLRERITVCYTIDASEYDGNAADLELRIYDGANLIGTAPVNEVGGEYVASFSGLNALQMRTVLTAEVYNGNTCVSNTLDYSIESYAASKAAGNDALASLVNAMMNFGISAEIYFAD